MNTKGAGIILTVLVFIHPGWAQAQDTKRDVPVQSINLLASKIKNHINLFSIHCENAKYGDQKIFCTSFNLRIEDKLTEKEKKGEQLEAVIKEIRKGRTLDLCKDKSITHFEQVASIYDRVKSGEEVRVSEKIITKKMLEEHLAKMKNEPMFRQFGGIDLIKMFRKWRVLCRDNAGELREIMEAGIIKGFENEKKTARVNFLPSRFKQEYKKDVETGAFYFERTRKNDCFRYHQRDEIRFDKDLLRFGSMALVAEYEENTAIVDMLRSDSKCLERAKGFSRKIIWRAGQRFELPSHWKFLDMQK